MLSLVFLCLQIIYFALSDPGRPYRFGAVRPESFRYLGVQSFEGIADDCARACIKISFI